MRSFFIRLTRYQAPQHGFIAKISTRWLCLIALCAGAGLPLALSPYHWYIIAIVSPAVLYGCLHQRSALQAFFIGWCYGFGLWAVGAFWLYTSIHVYGNTPASIAYILIGLMALIMGLFSAVQAWLYRRFFPETPLTFAPLWVLFEWVKTWIFTGFPWLFVGYAFSQFYLDEYAPLLGVLGVSFMAVLLAAGLAECILGKRFWLVPMAVVLVGAGIAKTVTWVQPKLEKPLSVSLIQGNIPQDLKWLIEYQAETLRIYAGLNQTEWGRDLIVWPEASIPQFQFQVQPFINAMARRAEQSGSAWVTGIPYFDLTHSTPEKPLYYNAIMATGAQSSGLYFKQRLVPFGEYIPFSGALAWVLPGVQDGVTQAGFSAGHDHQQPLWIKNHKLSSAICYEIAYPNLTRKNAQGSDFLVTISNDAWFTGTNGPWQHLQMAQMRAKENGRWIIRATNTGVTVIINAQGRIVRQLPTDKRMVLRGDLYAMQGQTLYSRLGDVPILIFCGLCLLLGWKYRPKNVLSPAFKQRR